MLYFCSQIRENNNIGEMVSLTEKGRSIMVDLLISCDCEECLGTGKIERTTGGWTAHGPWVDYKDEECRECDGTGKVSYRETYGSISDARDDYPKALRFTYL